MPVWERCLLLRGSSAFSYLGQPAILSIKVAVFGMRSGWSCPVTEFDPISVLLGAVVGAGFGGGVAWMVLRAGIGTQREAARPPLHFGKSRSGSQSQSQRPGAGSERKIAKRRESLDADAERQQQELREIEGRLDRRAKSWMLDPRRSPNKKSKRKPW